MEKTSCKENNRCTCEEAGFRDFLRMVDANVNRAAEGLRVLEDLARFSFCSKPLCRRVKEVRHQVRKGVVFLFPDTLSARDSGHDVGTAVSNTLPIDGKTSAADLIAANFKRAQEAVRVVEEALHLLGRDSVAKQYEMLRFSLYTLEQDFCMLRMRAEKCRVLYKPGIYCLTASEFSLGRKNVEVVRQMLDAGVKVVQYREKEMSGREKLSECREIRKMTAEAGALLIVDDDIDLALLCDADGVHLGQEDIPVEDARKLLPPQMIVGLSTHLPEQMHEAEACGADYIGVGPLYKTFTKKNVCDPVGLRYLRYVAEHGKLPYVAIGGIKEHNLHEVVEAGGKCIALVTEIVGAQEIGKKIASLQRILRETTALQPAK